MGAWKLSCLPVILVVVFLGRNVHSNLQLGFYKSSCSLAEFIVKDVVKEAFIKDNGVVADLVRMHFHDCFVRVSNSVQSFITCFFFQRFSSFTFFPPPLHFRRNGDIHFAVKILFYCI